MYVGCFLLAGLVSICVWALNISNVSAESPWFGSGEIGYSAKVMTETVYEREPQCTTQEIQVTKDDLPYTADSDKAIACVFDKGHWRYAMYARYYRSGWLTYTERSVVVGFGDEKMMYRVEGLPQYDLPKYTSDPDTWVYAYQCAHPNCSWGTFLRIFKDIPSRLVKKTRPHIGTYYEFQDFQNADFTALRPDGQRASVGAIGGDGKWLVFEVIESGLHRLDLETFEWKRFSDYGTRYGVGSNPSMEFGVSKDGSHVVVGGWNVESNLYQITDDCGNKQDQAFISVHKKCPQKSLEPVLSPKIEGYAQITVPSIDDESRQITLYANAYVQPWQREVTLTMPGYTPPTSLEYLALGDSYSSGEGDTEKDKASDKKYYRDYTDNEEDVDKYQPREKCHVSTRSYPYILSNGMALGDPMNNTSTKWQTVACSGAQIYDVTNNSSNYLGQGKGGSEGGKPRLAGYNAADFQSTALNEFIPGRDKQIEFVKKYKPKVITLTMGGNDVGFADKIISCASFSVSSTCTFASGRGRNSMAAQIRAEYNSLKEMYEALYEASGRTAKIYVLGYPQFINGGENDGCRAVGLLNNAEREMMSAATTYLNNVIRQAANAAGVKYVDIEDSLDGGRLCDKGQSYMTGIVGVPIAIHNQSQESFHPNAKGHHEIAMAIWEQVNNESLLDYDICPGLEVNICPDANATEESIPTPAFFQTTTSSATIHKYANFGISAKRDFLYKIGLGKYTFRPGSTIGVTAYSDPVEIGQYAAGDDGSLDIDIAIPDVLPAGYHTLVMSGQTYSGEPIKYEQVILVQGADANDLDENGIPDDQQPCGPFLHSSGEDVDRDGIDDACDPEIDSPPVNPDDSDNENPGNPDPTPNPGPNPTNPPVQPSPIEAAITKIKQVLVIIVTAIFKLFRWR